MRLQKLLDKKFITVNELNRIYKNDKVVELELHAWDKNLKEYNWYTVKTIEGKEYDVYTESLYQY